MSWKESTDIREFAAESTPAIVFSPAPAFLSAGDQAGNDIDFARRIFPDWGYGTSHDSIFSNEFIEAYQAWSEATNDYIVALEALASGLISPDTTFLQEQLNRIEKSKHVLQKCTSPR